MYSRDFSDKNIAFLFTIKNRTKLQYNNNEILNLLGNCLATLCNSLENYSFNKVHFYFADFGSDDCDLEKKLKNFIKLPFNFYITKIDDNFNKGKGYNTILDKIQIDEYDCIGFIDADMLFVRELVLSKAFSTVLVDKNAYYPICLRLDNDGTTMPPELDATGNCFIPPEIISKNNLRFISKYTWGEEDNYFLNTVKKHCKIIQEVAIGFYHQWHPYNWRRE